jgi:hypothetical protein
MQGKNFYPTLREKFLTLAKGHGLLDMELNIQSKVLKPSEAIGLPDRDDYPLLKGKEVLMEATFMGARGQAYTDAPSEFSGRLREVLHIDLAQPRQIALFISSLNAVMRYLHPDLKTVHCKDSGPSECALEIAEFLAVLRLGSVGLIGLQPAILDACASRFGVEKVTCVDRDEENRGQTKCGVPIEWGDHRGMREVFRKSDVVLATGSTVVNGSLPDILDLAGNYSREVYFFGTSIAGTALLMDLPRLCFRCS